VIITITAKRGTKSMQCPKCGNINKDSAKFCYNCGSNLERFQVVDTTKTSSKEKISNFFDNKIPQEVEVINHKYFSIPIQRPILRIIIFSIITLGIYELYLIFIWAKEINYLKKTPHYNAGLILFLSIITVGIVGIIYEIIFARDIEVHTKNASKPYRINNLSVIVIVLDVVGFLLSFTGFLIPLSFILGIATVSLIQRELNLLVEDN